jgi:hypothetical protein
MDEKKVYVDNLRNLLDSYDDVIEECHVNDEARVLNISYCERSYDLIDKDLDYDEEHHQHLLTSLRETLKNVGTCKVKCGEVDKMRVCVDSQVTRQLVRKDVEFHVERSDVAAGALELMDKKFLYSD